MQFNGGELWFDVLGVTPSRDRSLEEVKDQVEKRWRAEEISKRLRAKATDMIAKLEKGAKFDAEAAALGVKVETATAFKRDAEIKGVPERLIAAAFRTPKDGSRPDRRRQQHRLDRVQGHRRDHPHGRYGVGRREEAQRELSRAP